jgi:1-acyl-sn-glycerol-3-phosphate acyltransferase
MGWHNDVTIELPAKYVVALAPHTSNWDFILGQLYSRAESFRCQFMMKKEWFAFPLGGLMRSLGGIPVERSRKMSLTDQLAKAAIESDTFALCITPEGTRKPVEEWKNGFYYIALKAELPILLYGLDYKRRLIQCTKQVIPDGNFDKQIVEIKQYFEGFQGKYPEKFTMGL